MPDDLLQIGEVIVGDRRGSTGRFDASKPCNPKVAKAVAKRVTRRQTKERVTEMIEGYAVERKARKKKNKWPGCTCGEDSGWFVWGGDVATTTYTCDACGLTENALALGYDPTTIWVLASPIETNAR